MTQGRSCCGSGVRPAEPDDRRCLARRSHPMPNRPDDDAVFVPSLGHAERSFGRARRSVDLMVRLFASFGFETVIVETVGSGQGDTAIRQVADVVIVLVQPETGDELQWEKAGQLEIADIVVVHKADLPEPSALSLELRELLNLPGHRPVPVLRVSSSKGLGVEELWAACARLRVVRMASLVD